jgi:hypothetical protein
MREAVELERFLRGEIALGAFPHREHVRMGFELLKQRSFPDAASGYSKALREMTARAGKPHLFHQTITIAFLSLIAERMAACDAADFPAFARAYPDLFDRSVLERWYRPERLGSELARHTFLLPEPFP